MIIILVALLLVITKHCFVSEMKRNDNSNCKNGKFPSETMLLLSSDMLVVRKVSSFLYIFIQNKIIKKKLSFLRLDDRTPRVRE